MNKTICLLGAIAVILTVIFGLVVYDDDPRYQQKFKIEKDGFLHDVQILSEYDLSIKNFVFNEGIISFDLSSQRDGELKIQFPNEALQKDPRSGEIMTPIVLSDGKEIIVSQKSLQEKTQLMFYYDATIRVIEIVLFYPI